VKLSTCRHHLFAGWYHYGSAKRVAATLADILLWGAGAVLYGVGTVRSRELLDIPLLLKIVSRSHDVEGHRSMTTSSSGIVVNGTPPLRGKGSWHGSGYQREPRPGPVAISRAVVPLSRPA